MGTVRIYLCVFCKAPFSFITFYVYVSPLRSSALVYLASWFLLHLQSSIVKVHAMSDSSSDSLWFLLRVQVVCSHGQMKPLTNQFLIS